jgi:transposase
VSEPLVAPIIVADAQTKQVGAKHRLLFVGKERKFNRRFAQMRSHYLVEPVASTPASGWEKGQVENQVGLARERFFTPRPRVKSYDEMNAWLLDKCVAFAKARLGA